MIRLGKTQSYQPIFTRKMKKEKHFNCPQKLWITLLKKQKTTP